ncbi:hypothetical protein ACFQFR_32565 [Streptomyces goshikiensis]
MCTSTSVTPIAAKPSASAAPAGCQARSPGPAARTAAPSSRPAASTRSIRAPGAAAGGGVHQERQVPAARPGRELRGEAGEIARQVDGGVAAAPLQAGGAGGPVEPGRLPQRAHAEGHGGVEVVGGPAGSHAPPPGSGLPQRAQ